MIYLKLHTDTYSRERCRISRQVFAVCFVVCIFVKDHVYKCTLFVHSYVYCTYNYIERYKTNKYCYSYYKNDVTKHFTYEVSLKLELKSKIKM